MDIVDRMFQYMMEKNKCILLDNNVQLSENDLNIIVIKILSWLKLEYKREIWRSEGKKVYNKPLEINKNYPWCMNLCMLVEKESLFHDYFVIIDGKFNFADSVKETDRKIAREKAYKNYNPHKHM